MEQWLCHPSAIQAVAGSSPGFFANLLGYQSLFNPGIALRESVCIHELLTLDSQVCAISFAALVLFLPVQGFPHVFFF